MRSADTQGTGATAIPVHVIAPFGRDASVISDVLREAELADCVCDISPDHIVEHLGDHDGVLVCAQEGLTFALRERLIALCENQPPWAQQPLIFVVDDNIDTRTLVDLLDPLWSMTVLSVLHRPLREIELVTAVTNAVAARRRQLDIRDHVDREVELRHEINHRMKNQLSTVLAIYKMTVRASRDFDDFQARFDARMDALSSAQQILRASPEDTTKLGQLARSVLSPYLDDAGTRFTFDGQDLPITREASMTLALILNELATNAVKHGALAVEAGTVGIRWDRAEGILSLEWQEAGGPKVDAVNQASYGTRFINASAAAMGGKASLTFRPTGFACRLDLQETMVLATA